MKKSQEIIGLPVFSIVDGKKIGQVKDLVINPEEGKLDFILVSNGSWYVGARVLPYKAVMGIGEHAVTTESENLLSNIGDTSSASNLLQRNIEIKGNRVLTNKGNLIGVISEYEVDEISGKIIRLEYKTAQDESKIDIVEAADVLTYGADVIVVREKQDSPHPGNPSESEDITPKASGGENDGAAFFKARQKQFLLGKKLVQDVKDASGNILIAQGTLITEEIISLAEQYNRFTELSQCAK
ncbi:MAG: PRC-barrel domain-containing protein [Syntrophomonadaceae bacterium]|nr:PRC-barrel domain-containing protein [Syntrophomonadaceae bacterium]MDD3271695.1 PRC-barrel domain-containing protein [Syntrophomonadaceae bacterium]MDD3898366.1 PRC-barrel domain-containing protein [Syntrophomonadaceae bacterium]MDD4562874.1 PRC-barrel domain-containing protein [Syntrophomonadaceae bacterium]